MEVLKFWELVRKYNNLKFKIRSKINEEAELRELGSLPKTSDMSVPGSSGHSSPVENYVIRLDEIKQDQIALDEKLQEVRNKIMAFIETLDDYFARQCVELVVFRPTAKPNWAKVARSIGYSQSGARALYKTATKNLEKEELTL